MLYTSLPIDGAYLINLDKREDERGFFSRYYCEQEFAENNLNTSWPQVNNSLSKKRGTLRGLHFQRPPSAEVKLVRCLRGSIWDVIVDIREGSPTYRQWFGEELSAENRTMMYVPEGCAHGFVSLEDDSEILYMVSSPYDFAHEGTVKWNDPFHQIEWPIEPVVISDKDEAAELWSDDKAIRL